MRHFLLAIALVASVQTGAPAADSRPGVYPFNGTMSFDCFGCGTSGGSVRGGSFCVVSKDSAACAYPRGEQALFGSNTSADYVANEPADVTCIITGSASGYMWGALNVDFNWTRMGHVFIITTSGDVNGAGTGVFQVIEPMGIPCGQPAVGYLVGEIAGV
jgi:hypothetical protein